MTMHPVRHLSAAAALFAAALLASCESPTGGGSGAPARMDVVAGDLQTTTAGAELPQALVVRVLDERGHPVRGQIVNFVVTAGGGAVFAGSANTNQEGEARERWTLGTVAGDTQRVEVRAVDAGTGAPQVFATFRAVASPAAPASVVRLGPTPLQGEAGAPLAGQVAVKVVDRYGNAVPGVEVAWAAAPGHGSFSPAASRTDAAGVAGSAWTLGTSGTTQQATATVTGLAPVQLSAVVHAGVAARIEITPDSLSFTALRQEQRLGAAAYDAFGNVAAGAPVRWTSLDTAVVRVHAEYGVATAWGPGTGRVVARVEGSEARDTVTVRVRQVPATVRIIRRHLYGGPYHTVPGDSIRLPLEPTQMLDANGYPIAGDFDVEWTSSNPAVARVGPTDYFVPLQPTGNFWATVAVGGARDSVYVDVRSARTAADLAGGAAGHCLLQETGSTWCAVLLGSLADFPRGDAIPGGAVEVAIGYRHLCALLPSGEAYCKGSGDDGQLGDGYHKRMPGDTAGSIAPHDGAGNIVRGGLRFTSLAAGYAHSCGVALDGVVYCWGSGSSGQLGSGVRTRALDPTPVTGSETLRFKKVYAAANGTCALSTEDAVFCWGSGGGGNAAVPTPMQAPRAFTQLTMGSGFVCGLDAGGGAWCWGSDSEGQLGNGTGGSSLAAQPVSGGHTFTQIQAGPSHACALTPEGEVRCWGSNRSGQVGTGAQTESEPTPQPLVEPRRFRDLALSGGYTCALSLNRVTVCWGQMPGGYKGSGLELLPRAY